MGRLSGFPYRRLVPVHPSFGAGTGYQVTHNVVTADFGGLCRADFGDVRFTALDGTTQLKYLITAKTDGVSATFLVQVTDDLNYAEVGIFMYFGNPTETTTGSTTVYDFYDDASVDGRANYVRRKVEGGSLTTLGWSSSVYSASVPANDSYFFEIQGLTSGGNYELQIDYKVFLDRFSSSGNLFATGFGGHYTSSGMYFVRDIQYGAINQKYLTVTKEDHPGTTPVSNTELLPTVPETNWKPANTWFTCKGRFYNNNFYFTTSYQNEEILRSDSTYKSGTYGVMFTLQNGNLISFRNLVVRHYTYPEPYVINMGPIETEVVNLNKVESCAFASVYVRAQGEKWQTLGAIENGMLNIMNFSTLDSFGKNKPNGALNLSASCKMKQTSIVELGLNDTICNGRNDFLFKLTDSDDPSGLAVGGWVLMSAIKSGVKAKLVADGDPRTNRVIELVWRGSAVDAYSEHINLLSPILVDSDFESSSDAGTFHSIGLYTATSDGGSAQTSHLVPCGVLSVDFYTPSGSTHVVIGPVSNVRLSLETIPSNDTLRRYLPNTVIAFAEYDWMATDSDDVQTLDEITADDVSLYITMLDGIVFALSTNVGIASNFESVGDTDKARVTRFTHQGRILQSSLASIITQPEEGYGYGYGEQYGQQL